MADKSCVQRLQKEFKSLSKDPVPHIVARPSPNNILEWHYVLEGSEGTPFAGGYYHGKIKFPPKYPYKPPGISIITPSGRFMTQTKICLSMSDFHPESWNPIWSVSSILNGLLSFMMEDSPTTGSVDTSVAEKQKLAKDSLAFNCKNPTFRKMFPEYVDKYNQQLAEVSKLSPGTAKEEGEEDSQLTRPENVVGHDSNERGTLNRVEPVQKQHDRRSNKGQYFPSWLLILLFSLLGVVMALPLLQT